MQPTLPRGIIVIVLLITPISSARFKSSGKFQINPTVNISWSWCRQRQTSSLGRRRRRSRANSFTSSTTTSASRPSCSWWSASPSSGWCSSLSGSPPTSGAEKLCKRRGKPLSSKPLWSVCIQTLKKLLQKRLFATTLSALPSLYLDLLVCWTGNSWMWSVVEATWLPIPSSASQLMRKCQAIKILQWKVGWKGMEKLEFSP